MRRPLSESRPLCPPPQPEPRCPVCGEALGWMDLVYLMGGGDVAAGCSVCLRPHNAGEWFCGEMEEDGLWQGR